MQRNMNIQLLNPYGLLLKRTGPGLFSSFDFARLLRLNRKTRHLLLRLRGRPESGAANRFKEEFFNLYKILRLQCTPQNQDEDAPGFCVYREAEQAPAAHDRTAGSTIATLSSMERVQLSRISRGIAQRFASLRIRAGCCISEVTQP